MRSNVPMMADKVNNIPPRYVFAEVIGGVEGFPYVLVEFTLPGNVTVTRTVERKLVNNLQRVVCDD